MWCMRGSAARTVDPPSLQKKKPPRVTYSTCDHIAVTHDSLFAHTQAPGVLLYSHIMFRSATVLSRRWVAQGVVTCSRSFSVVKKKKTIQDLAKEVSLRGKPVLVRADLNLPRSKEDGSITDDTRARAVSRGFRMFLLYIRVLLIFSCKCIGCSGPSASMLCVHCATAYVR